MLSLLHRSPILLSGSILLACFLVPGIGISVAGDIDIDGNAGTEQAAVDSLRISRPGATIYRERDGRIARIYGAKLSEGRTPEESADQFVMQNAAIWGIDAADLIPRGPFPDGRHLQGIVYEQARDAYTFTGVYYAQGLKGIPVFQSRLMVLVRNEEDYPAVLIGSDMRDLAGLDLPDAIPAAPGNADALRVARKRFGADAALHRAPRYVIFAGSGFTSVPAQLAVEFETSSGTVWDGAAYRSELIVMDAGTFEVLHVENRILNCGPPPLGVAGVVEGRSTIDSGADICDDEVAMPMPFARIASGGDVIYTNAEGQFWLPTGDDPITITSEIRGQWFRVYNQWGSNSSLSLEVDPPDQVAFLHNSSNSSEAVRAEVNGYIQANTVRSFTLSYNPTYPGLGQSEFAVNVNINSSCNAFYDGSSINFYRSGGGCSNTAFSVVVHHEYGHHLVSVGGSGQNEYGEGMGDVMGVLITGDSELGRGFQGNCNSGIRSADNNCQYTSNCSSCGSAIHTCGQLISGCVWDTREALLESDPLNGAEIINNLAVNSILLHNGGSITPAIAIDYLTIDDNDFDITNGTPHYFEIATGFNAHGMDVPELQLLYFNLPDGQPEFLNPYEDNSILLQVESLSQPVLEGTAVMYVEQASGSQTIPMSYLGDGFSEAFFPPVSCDEVVEYYFSSLTENGVLVYWPQGAPGNGFVVVTGTDGEVTFDDDFNTNQGWQVSSSGPLSDGAWQRGVPAGGGDRGDPPTDYDGSGMCYVTDNADGNSDVDGGTTILTSPVMDASNPSSILSYARWYSNTFGADPENDVFLVEISGDDGSTWTTLETVGPSGSEVDGGWFTKEFLLAEYMEPSHQFKVRFLAGDFEDSQHGGSVIEAGVDAVHLTYVECAEPPSCPEDINQNGTVDFQDLLVLLSAWGPCDASCPGDFDANGSVDFQDLITLLSAWGNCG